jgi:DNA-directed RNA polymerase subunit RPC12/RpoP
MKSGEPAVARDIIFFCGSCKKRLVVVEQGAGRLVPCPQCGNNIAIPPQVPQIDAINKAIVRMSSQMGEWVTTCNKYTGEECQVLMTDSRAISELRNMIIDAGYDSSVYHVPQSSPVYFTNADWLRVIFRTNSLLRLGQSYWRSASSPDMIPHFPAMRLTAKGKKNIPKKVKDSWVAAGGVLRSGKLIALKNDDVWRRYSVFGLPFPPYDMSDNTWVEDVNADTCERLGIFSNGTKLSVQREYDIASKYILLTDCRICDHVK